jgi:peroxiredoxin
MRIKGIVFFILVALVAGWLVYREASRVGSRNAIAIGAPVPDFTVKDQDGKEVKLSDFRGSLVFMNIWATWCPPCVEEMPAMETLNNKFKNRKFQMMAVSVDTDWTPVLDFYMTHQLSLPTYLDPGRRVFLSFKATGVPETFVIDGNGILLKRYIGERAWSTPEMLASFDAMITAQETAQRASQ